MDPGESLFCGGTDNLQPNPSAGLKEEEEDRNDQHRRDVEIGNLLSDVFDDLSHSDEDGDDNSDRSEGSSCQGSPQVSPSGYYSYNAPLSQLHYNNGFDHIKAHSMKYPGDQANKRLPQQNGLSNGCSPTDDDDDQDDMYNCPPYQMDTDRMNGDGYSPTDNHYYRNADLGSHEQLMVLYTARNREVKNLTEALECLRQEKDSEIALLKRELLVKETEKQAATLSHKEALNLLDASKTQVNALQQELNQLRTSNLNLEKEKTDLLKEVNLFKSSAADLQQKVILLERNGNTLVPSEKQMESYYKSMQQRHQFQLKEMQLQLENVIEKLKLKEGECIALEEKLRNATRGYDALQVSKGETVNRLAAQLEEAQEKLQKLASNSAVHETTKLQLKLEHVQNQKEALEEELASTLKKLESAENDLHQYESVRRLGLFDNEDSSFETDSITHLGISRRHSLGGRSDMPANTSKDSGRSRRSSTEQEDINAKIKAELRRALQGQHSKREEIRSLQHQLSAKEKKIQSMLQQEQTYVTEANKYQANLKGVLDRMKRQQEELKSASANETRLKARCEELERCLAEATEKVERLLVLEKENAALREQILVSQLEEKEKKLSPVKGELPPAIEKELVDLKVRLEQSQKECAEIKQLYIQITADKRELMSRLEEKDSLHEKELKTAEKRRSEFEALYQECQETIQNLKVELDAAIAKGTPCDENLIETEKEKEENEKKFQQLLEKIAFLESGNKRTNDLELKCLRLQEELADESSRHQKELEIIRKESSHSRERLLQLERKSREEIQALIDAKTSEVDHLQKQLDQKNQLLEECAQALSRLKPATKEAAVETTDEGWRERTAALAVQLEKAEERHRNVVEALRDEFDRQIAAQEKDLKASHERQLVMIAERYKREVAAIEDQVKEEAAKYFASEVTALQEKHAQEISVVLNRMKESEAMYANHVEQLKKLLQERIREIEDSKKNFMCGNCDDVKQLKEQIDSERNKMAEIMNSWLAENHKLTEERDVLQTKYKELKKAALHYKKEVAQMRQEREQFFRREKQGYREALCRVKERVDEVAENHEKDRRSSEEKLYENQLLDIAAKLRSERI